MSSKGQQHFILTISCLIALLSLTDTLAAQPLLQRGGVDVNPPRNRLSLDVGVGLSGLGEGEASLVVSLTPRYEIWRRGGLSLHVALPLSYIPDPVDSETEGPPCEGFSQRPRTRRAPAAIEADCSATVTNDDPAFEIATGLEFELPPIELGTRCCLTPSFFVGGGFRFESRRAVDLPFAELPVETGDAMHPLVTLGVAVEQRFSRRHSLRVALRVSRIFEEDVEVGVGGADFSFAGKDITTGTLTVGLALDF